MEISHRTKEQQSLKRVSRHCPSRVCVCEGERERVRETDPAHWLLSPYLLHERLFSSLVFDTVATPLSNRSAQTVNTIPF